MASPTGIPCLSCEDSPLSITGNIVGILTFASAIIIGVQVYINSMRNAEYNIYKMTSSFESRLEEARRLRQDLEDKRVNLNSEQDDRIKFAMERVGHSLLEASRLLDRLHSRSYDGRSRLWVRARFILREDLIKKGLEETEKALQAVKDAATDVLAQQGSEVEDQRHFRQLVMTELIELKEETRSFRAQITGDDFEPRVQETAFREEILHELAKLRDEISQLSRAKESALQGTHKPIEVGNESEEHGTARE